jgi:GntR family transcriptional regulator
MKLNDNSLTPLYQQVLDDIKAHINSGSYAPGQRIPSEAELSQMYSVSRVTVRRAIEELSGEGYLTKRQGKGTYVNQRKMTRKIRQSSDVQSFTSVCAEMGMRAGAHVLEQRVVSARDEERRLFGEGCERLVYVSRVRTADGIPIMEERNLLPLEGFAFLLEADLEDASFFEAIRTETGLEPQTSGSSTIEIALADAQMAKSLQIAAGDPLFYERVFFVDQHGKPLCLSNKYLVGSRYQFDI